MAVPKQLMYLEKYRESNIRIQFLLLWSEVINNQFYKTSDEMDRIHCSMSGIPLKWF